MAELTVVQALRQDLEHFEYLDDFAQESVADYFECPNLENCELDHSAGLSMHEREHVCSMCKVRWLLSRWED